MSGWRDDAALAAQGQAYTDEQARELKQLEGEFRELLSGDVARLNEAARRLEVPAVVVPRAEDQNEPAGRPRPGSESRGAPR